MKTKPPQKKSFELWQPRMQRNSLKLWVCEIQPWATGQFLLYQTLNKQGESEGAFQSANKVREKTFTWENRGQHYSNNYLCQTNLSTKLVYRVIPFQEHFWQKDDITLLEWLIEKGKSQSDSYFISAMETSSV